MTPRDLIDFAQGLRASIGVLTLDGAPDVPKDCSSEATRDRREELAVVAEANGQGAAGENGRLVWDDPELADTAGALTLRRSLREVLDAAGLISAEPALQVAPVTAGVHEDLQHLQPAQAQP